MANTVSNISINFGANTSALKAGIGEVSSILGGLRTNVANAGAKLGGGISQLSSGLTGLASAAGPVGLAIAAGAAAGTAAIWGVTNAISGQMSAIDELAKSADTAGLSMQTFQGLALSADLSGVAAEGFTKSMVKLQRSLVDARSGTGPAADAFRELGLNVDAVSHMNSEDALASIADGIAGIEDPAQRASLAIDIFGKSGADLIPLLAGGSSAVKAGVDAVNKYNIAISRSDAAKIEAANDAWTMFGKTVEGIWNQLAVAFAPATEAVGMALADLGGQIAGVLKESGPLIAEFASRAVQMFVDLAGWAGKIIAKVADFMEAVVKKAREWGVIGAEAKQMSKGFSFPALEAAENWGKATDAISDAAKEAEKLMKAGEALTKSLRLPDEIYADTIAELKQLAAAGAITQETFTRGYRKAAEELDKATSKAEKAFQPLNAGAVTRNSSAGFSAVIDGQNAQKKIEGIVQKQLEEQRKHTKQNEEMIAAYKEATTVKQVSI